MGITLDELNIMLGIVSWATCGDGRSRRRRARDATRENNHTREIDSNTIDRDGELSDSNSDRHKDGDLSDPNSDRHGPKEDKIGRDDNEGGDTEADVDSKEENEGGDGKAGVDSKGEGKCGDAEAGVDGAEEGCEVPWERRAAAGRRAKALLDWGRARALRRRGLAARLLRFVPAAVSLENLCIVASART